MEFVTLNNGVKMPLMGFGVFQVRDNNVLLSEYLMMWLTREETQRYMGFISWGSTRDILQFETLGEIKIPIPDIGVQQSIVNIYNAYIMRREINEKMKAQTKDICPILIKGSLEETSA